MNPFKQTLDQKIFLFALPCLMLASALLYDDNLLFQLSNQAKQNVVGSIQAPHRDVRRKNIDQPFWQPAQLNESLFNEGSIASGQNSSAEIALFDGSLVELQENSLLQIKRIDGKVILNLQDGWAKVSFKQGRTFALKQEDKQIIITTEANGSLKLKKSRDGEINLILEKGLARANNLPLQVDSPLMIQSGQISPQRQAQIYLEQNPDQPVEYLDNEKPHLKYSLYGSATNVRLVFSPRTAATTAFEVSFDAHQNPQWPAQIQDGQYKVQLFANTASGESISSNARDLEVIKIQTPRLNDDFKTTHHAIVQPDNEGLLKKDLELKWSGSKVKSYLVQITDDDNFDRPRTYLVDTPSLKLAQLSSGRYQVRIQAQGVTRHSPWSQPFSFQLNLESEELYRPPTPSLTKAEIDYSPDATLNEMREHGPVLTWSSGTASNPQSLENVQYKVQLSHFEDFRTFSEASVQNGNSLEWTRFQRGQYYFRVVAQNALGLTSQPSATGKLNIQLKDIELKPVETAQNKEQNLISVGSAPVQLTWSKSSRAALYQVEVATKEDFKEVSTFQTRQPFTALSLKPGKYYVRISGYDSHGTNMKITSNVQPIEYDATATAQEISHPEVSIQWDQVAGAHSYVVEFARDPEFLQVIHSLESRENTTVISEHLPAGQLYWRVKALSKLRRQIANVSSREDFSNRSGNRSFLLSQQHKGGSNE